VEILGMTSTQSVRLYTIILASLFIVTPLSHAGWWETHNPWRVRDAQAESEIYFAPLTEEAEATHWKALNVNVEPELRGIAETERELGDVRWNTPELRHLIQKAIAQNPSIIQATDRITQAKALQKNARSTLLPQVSLQPSYSRIKLSDNQFLFGQNISIPAYNNFDMPLVASYELDVFGSNRDGLKMSKSIVESQGLQLEALKEQLIAEVTVSYLNALNTKEMLRVQQKRLNLLQADAKRQAAWVEVGIADQQSLAEKKKDTHLTEQQLHLIEQMLQIHKNSLHVLQGEAPTMATPITFTGDIRNITPSLHLNAGLPSTLIESRPDLLAAQQALKQQEIRYSIAKRLMLPKFRLQASASLLSTQANTWLNWDSFAYNLVGGIVQPLFTGGQIRSEIDFQKSETGIVLQQYHASIVNAFNDVETSLIALNTSRDEHQAIQAAYDQLKLKQEKEQLKVEAGILHSVELSPLLLDLNTLERALAQNRTQQLINEVTLLKALGRGRNLL
jgi:NodT family efflux transporter outer membrane factor (OMF) lipoprotein